MIALRSVAAVASGYAVFAISAACLFRFAQRDPHAPQGIGFIALAVVYGTVFAGAGGLLAASLAPARGVFHAVVVSLLIAAGAAVSLAASPGAGATWSQWTALTLCENPVSLMCSRADRQ